VSYVWQIDEKNIALMRYFSYYTINGLRNNRCGLLALERLKV